MSDYGVITEAGSVRFERLLPGPIERVWDYLTDSEKRGKWLATGRMELRIGGRVELHFVHASLSPHREEVPEKYKAYGDGVTNYGCITQLRPPHLLAYTWGETQREPGAPPDSEVTFELTPKGSEVLLVLTHRRLRDRGEMVSVSSGWHAHLGILADNLRGDTPRPFWSVHTKLESDYESRISG